MLKSPENLKTGLPEPPFFAGAGAVFFGPAPGLTSSPTPTLRDPKYDYNYDYDDYDYDDQCCGAGAGRSLF